MVFVVVWGSMMLAGAFWLEPERRQESPYNRLRQQMGAEVGTVWRSSYWPQELQYRSVEMLRGLHIRHVTHVRN